LEDLGLFHIVNDVVHLIGCLKTNLTDIIIAEFERNRKDILEDCFGLIYLGKSVKLMRYFIPDSPLLRILLKNKKNINQVFSCGLFEKLHKFREMRDGCEFEEV
jgi:hypothetical protein